MRLRVQNREARRGIIGTLILVLIVGIALSGTAVDRFFGGDTFHAEFTEAGGLTVGDDVIVSGVVVGEVTEVELVGDRVRVGFVLDEVVPDLGTSTQAEVASRTALGKKALLVVPAGGGILDPDDVIPVERTTPSFDILEALSSLTKEIQPLDSSQLATSLDTLSTVLDKAAPEVRPALSGLSRLARTLNARDDQLTSLLDGSADVSATLAGRDRQVQKLFADGASLLAALNGQSIALDQLFENATEAAKQVSGLIDDNEKQIGPTLRELNKLLRMLEKNKANIDHALTSAGPLMRELGEVVAAFPGFNVYIPNLVLTNLAPVVPGVLVGGEGR